MKFLLFIIINGMFLMNCNCVHNNSKKDFDLMKNYELWDSSTLTSLENIEKSNSFLKGRAIFLKSFFQKESDINLLNRKQFANVIENKKSIEKFKNEFIIVELKESGEKISNMKSIINPITRAYNSFTEDEKGDWVNLNSGILTNDQITQITNIDNVGSESKFDLWGNKVNDVLLITMFSNSWVKVRPVLLVESQNINFIKNLLFSK